MSFWVVAVLIAGLAALGLALAMARGRASSSGKYDLQVYRDQLNDVERDIVRGVIPPDEADRLRTEIGRRILDADQANAKRGLMVSGAGAGGVGVVLGLLVLAGSAAIYTQLGSPGYRDLPLEERLTTLRKLREDRPLQAEAETTFNPATPAIDADPKMLDLLEKLRAALISRPDDLQGHVLLARNEAALGDFVAAHQAQARVIAIKGEDVTATDFADYADLLILAAGGYVSPEAERALAQALQRDTGNGTALYYSGQMFAQSGRPDLAFRIWRPLLEDSDPDAPWVGPIRAQIEAVAADAGVQYQLPAAARVPGPSAEDINAASDMSAQDRAQMIRGMVNGLSDRLATQGGTPSEWARLIGALGVLGEADRAAAIWAEAQTVFAGKPDMLAEIRAAATQAGVAN